jgi:hypothetical protein
MTTSGRVVAIACASASLSKTYDRRNPERAQHPAFGGCARRAGDLMLGFAQQAGEPSPDDTRRTCQENSHFAPR